MHSGERIAAFSVRHPIAITVAMAAAALGLALAAAVPTIWPERLPLLHPITVDTDPENMLSEDEAVRVFHDEMKHALDLHDIVVVGVVNESHPQGVFNQETLARVYELTEFAKTLRGAALGQADPQAGVVEIDIIAPSTVDNIEQGGIGVVRFEWLMPHPPESDEAALAVRDKARRIPFLDGTLLSEDGKALAIYLPLTSKSLSYRVYMQLRNKVATFEGDEKYYITGLPVAEDTFGVEMFIQMAISAPAAMFIIFLLMLAFFRKLVLIVSPLIVAMASVLITMGLLVVTGNTVHIMSSMIPIFIMPIAVLDSVHILSEFFDRYQKHKDREKTIRAVMDELFVPMLYTSLTSAAGFGSLALAPIPPVQVFGIFVCIGVLTAWVLTIVFVPAYVMLIPERAFANFGAVHREGDDDVHGLMGRVLRAFGHLTFNHGKAILAVAAAAVIVAIYGISLIQINDNPTKWFKPTHPIRVADSVLNEHFAGTYMAYLSLSAPEEAADVPAYAQRLAAGAEAHAADAAGVTPEVTDVLPAFLAAVDDLKADAPDPDALREQLAVFVEEQETSAEGNARYAWEEFRFFLDAEAQRGELFKQPEALAYIEGLQEHLVSLDAVGKSNSLADIVKTVHRELFEGDPAEFRIPDSDRAVAQCLITYESSHRPHDIYHFVTPDYARTSLWVQLNTGDNRDMSAVVESVENFIAANPPPFGLEHDWFGLTYINVIWQEKMVAGMLEAFLGSFLVVLIMMTFLFRSALWGLISMIPLTITIGLIYGIIGLVGKDYDMPVAVLSSLTLGLAVDFAIHFLVRSRGLHGQYGSWKETYAHVFGEPARAIARNGIVLAVGFLPLVFAPLVPYQTVGIFLAAILTVSGLATLLILPALIRWLEPLLFPRTDFVAISCRFATAVLLCFCVLLLIGVNVHQFLELTWPPILAVSAPVFAVCVIVSWIVSRRRGCTPVPEAKN